MAKIVVLANRLAKSGVEKKAGWIREEFITTTAIAVIVALRILLVSPKGSRRAASLDRRSPVRDKRLVGSPNYCSECGSKV
jgi:hypothetical protein